MPEPLESASAEAAPIGVFDSGMGGLTVLRALERALQEQAFVYLGDTARLPYGTKSAKTVERYALRASRELVERSVSALVVACNTASAVALEALRQAPGLGRWECGIQRGVAVGVEIVLDQYDFVRFGEHPRGDELQGSGVVLLCTSTTFADVDLPAAL